MKKLEMVRKIAEKTELSHKNVDAVLTAFAEVATEAMKEQDEVSLTGFGKFTSVVKPAHKGVNPATGEEIMIEEKIQPKCKFSSVLKDNLN